MHGKAFSYLLVTIQFGSLAVFAATGPWFARTPLLLAIEISGFALGTWAILAVRGGNFNILPDVRPHAEFVRRGPYRWIRHPMYASLLLIAAALTLDQPSAWRVAALAVLLADILVKLHYEERLLAAAFPDYAAYQRQTKRLAPFIY